MTIDYIDSDVYGFQHSREGFGETNVDEFQEYWPEVKFVERRGVGEGMETEQEFCRREDQDYRTGYRPMRRRNSINPSWEECAAQRYMDNTKTCGYPPYVKWESLTDTATSPYEAETTGNARLPKSKEEWEAEMKSLREKWDC